MNAVLTIPPFLGGGSMCRNGSFYGHYGELIRGQFSTFYSFYKTFWEKTDTIISKKLFRNTMNYKSIYLFVHFLKS